MNIKFIIIFFIFCNLFPKSHAQESHPDTIVFVPRILTTEEFKNFRLPSLESLYDKAKSNPRLKAVETAISTAKYDKRLKKRDWFSYFSVRGGYTYGILGIYSDVESEYNPLTTTYSGSTQSSWSVGASVNIPLDHLINHRLTVKKTQQAIENAEYTHAIIFNEIKGEIIELYSNIQYSLGMLNSAAEAVTLHNANYNIAKSDFMNNKTTTNDLSQASENRKKSQEQYETIINQLKIMILKLEILTGTKLISQ